MNSPNPAYNFVRSFALLPSPLTELVGTGILHPDLHKKHQGTQPAPAVVRQRTTALQCRGPTDSALIPLSRHSTIMHLRVQRGGGWPWSVRQPTRRDAVQHSGRLCTVRRSSHRVQLSVIPRVPFPPPPAHNSALPALDGYPRPISRR